MEAFPNTKHRPGFRSGIRPLHWQCCCAASVAEAKPPATSGCSFWAGGPRFGGDCAGDPLVNWDKCGKTSMKIILPGKPWGFYFYIGLPWGTKQLTILVDLLHWNANRNKIGCWSRKLRLGFSQGHDGTWWLNIKNIDGEVRWVGCQNLRALRKPGPRRYLGFSAISAYPDVPYNENAWQLMFSNILSCVKIYDKSYNDYVYIYIIMHIWWYTLYMIYIYI